MAINLENELKAVSVRLKALSKKVDKIAAGIGKQRKTKKKFVLKKDASLTETPTNKNDFEIESDIVSVLTQGVGDAEQENSSNLKSTAV